MTIQIQHHDFDVGHEIAQLRAADGRIGAVVSFVGTVRDFNQNTNVSQLELEHYSGMTEKALEKIVAAAKARWDMIDALVIHRVGVLKPLEQIVLVAVAASHRSAAFCACEFITDYLKTDAPFWKKEVTEEGTRWLEVRASDQTARRKWERDSNSTGETV